MQQSFERHLKSLKQKTETLPANLKKREDPWRAAETYKSAMFWCNSSSHAGLQNFHFFRSSLICFLSPFSNSLFFLFWFDFLHTISLKIWRAVRECQMKSKYEIKYLLIKTDAQQQKRLSRSSQNHFSLFLSRGQTYRTLFCWKTINCIRSQKSLISSRKECWKRLFWLIAESGLLSTRQRRKFTTFTIHAFLPENGVIMFWVLKNCFCQRTYCTYCWPEPLCL